MRQTLVFRRVKQIYTVRRGDSLWSISRRYKVKINDLMRWNDLARNAVIQPGQSIKINL